MADNTGLIWDEVGERYYETGVRKLALYPYDTTTKKYTNGVAWDGVTSVTESPSGAEATDMYADDIKYLSLISAEKLDATLEAYFYPDEFEECDGTSEITSGVKIGQQSRKTFGMCYRTIIGNDTENENYGYKLHLMYGCKATPSQRQYQTVNESPNANTFSWSINTTPVNVTGYKPTSLLTITSTEVDPAKLTALEDKLYGRGNYSVAELPLPDEVISIFGATVKVTFNSNGHGTSPEAQTINKGGTAVQPQAPEATGYVFGGWYTEAACTNAFNFSTPINANITLYAKWTAQECAVVFNFNGHGGDTQTEYTSYGQPCTRIDDPEAEGYTFGGWYTEADCINQYDFTAPVVDDIVLYAKWTESEG